MTDGLTVLHCEKKTSWMNEMKKDVKNAKKEMQQKGATNVSRWFHDEVPFGSSIAVCTSNSLFWLG